VGSARVAGERFRSSRMAAHKIAGEGIGSAGFFLYLHTSGSSTPSSRKEGKRLGGCLQPSIRLEKGSGENLASYLEKEVGLPACRAP
jgi:hypothetical protein